MRLLAAAGNRFATASPPLKEDGFEPSVPRCGRATESPSLSGAPPDTAPRPTRDRVLSGIPATHVVNQT
jgi:hypothetical protein